MSGDESLAAWLARAGAQHDFVEWAAPFGSDVAALWAACPRGDWALALAARVGVERGSLLEAAAGCARLAAPYLSDSDAIAERCLQALEAHARDEAPAPNASLRHQLLDAHAGAREAAQSEAILAVIAALDALEEPGAAAGAPAFAAHAAMVGTPDCAMLEAMRFVQRASADEARRCIAAPHLIERWSQRAR